MLPWECSVFATPRVMLLRLNQSLKYCELIPTPDSTGPAPSFVPLYSEYSTPPMSSMMPQQTSLRWPKYSCRKKFPSDSWRLKHLKLHHPEHLQVANTLTVCSTPRSVEPTQRLEFNANQLLFEDWDAFPRSKHFENIAASGSQPPPHPLQRMETYPGARARLRDDIAERGECDAQGYLATNQQYNLY